MEDIFLKLVNMSINAGWLVLVVLVVRFLLKKAPKYVHCILWALVAFRLICPYSIESAMSLLPSAKTIEPQILLSETPAIDSGIEMVNHSVNTVLASNATPVMGASVNPLQVWTEMAACVWIVGMVLILMYSLIAYLRLKRRVRASIRLNSKNKDIRLCDDIESPFVLGIVRPVIYLPSDLSEKEQNFVIAHEQAHLKRHDHFWKPLGFILLAFYWFNPLMWIAYILLCRDIEMACDERVVYMMNGRERKQYSGALLACSVPRHMVAACPLAFGEVGVKQRVKNVLNYKKPVFWIMFAAIAAGVMIALCFLTNPKEQKDGVKQTTENITENDLEAEEKVDDVLYYLQSIYGEEQIPSGVTFWTELEADKVCIGVQPDQIRDFVTYYYIPEGELQDQLETLITGMEIDWNTPAPDWKFKKRIGWEIVYNDLYFEGCEDGYLYARKMDSSEEYLVKQEELCSLINEALAEFDYAPVDVSTIKDIQSATLTFNCGTEDGKYYKQTITDSEALKNFEEWFSNAEFVYRADTCVTGRTCMELNLKNGKQIALTLTDDDCAYMAINGMHYDYRPKEYRETGGFGAENVFKYFDEIANFRKGALPDTDNTIQSE